MSSKIKSNSSRRILSVLMAIMLSVCLTFSAIAQTSAATTADDKVDEVKNSILQVLMTYQPDDSDRVVVSSGTCFLINSTTAVSCAHIFEPSINKDLRDKIAKTYGVTHKFDKKYIKDYQVLVNGGVPVNATIRKINLNADYSIIKLDETVARPIVTLGHSSDVQVTQQIYTLGFPATVTMLQDSKTYTTEQVAITSSTISNVSTTAGVDYITHNANISNGNSGGPLVDEDGNVIGINLYKTDDSYFLAAAIDQVVALLDDLDIEYTRAGNTNTDTESDVTEPETEAVTEAPATEPVTEPVTEPEPEPEPIDSTKLIVIIAIIVLLIIIIAVVIVIVLNSKKKVNKIPNNQQKGTVIPGPTGVPNRMTPPYPTNRPNNYQPPQSVTMPSNEGAGETSVLNDGAGETTVLGNQSAGYTIIRKRNNEKIKINKPEFVIGKERRRVDYCISDNNSISRVHAKIKVRAGRCYIADLGSTNCTYVNGTKLSPNQEVILSKGDTIKVSDEEFEFLG